jgi:hypothetical protein
LKATFTTIKFRSGVGGQIVSSGTRRENSFQTRLDSARRRLRANSSLAGVDGASGFLLGCPRHRWAAETPHKVVNTIDGAALVGGPVFLARTMRRSGGHRQILRGLSLLR